MNSGSAGRTRALHPGRTSHILTTAVLCSALLGGCSRGEEGEADRSAAAAASARVPAGEPGIRGVVTLAEAGSLRVEENPNEESGSPKAVVRLEPGTEVMYRSGEASAVADLTLGHYISVWFDGPVMESYPVQGTAATIVIEPAVGP